MNGPKDICIIRLSAIGDVCNCIPVLRALQMQWPEAEVTWIVGKTEHSIVRDLEGVKFVVFDKAHSFREFFRINRLLRHKRYDVLLQMQASLRASLLSYAISAIRRIGFDKGRSKDFQTLFSNEKIDPSEQAHMVETFLDFSRKAGAVSSKPVWNLSTQKMHNDLIQLDFQTPNQFYIVSPCSSKKIRNWRAERYAEVVKNIWNRTRMICLVTGGSSQLEQEYGTYIQAQCGVSVINLVGKTNLRQLMALLEQAVYVIAPDSGPAHMAAAVGVPVIGLYANTNPDRARSYSSKELVVNKYPDALQRYYNKGVKDVPWGTRVRVSDVMDLITVNDVLEKVDCVAVSRS